MDERGVTLFQDAIAPEETAPAGAAEATYLIVLAGGIPGAMIPLAPGANRLGRSPENSIPLASTTVSRRHAVLEVAPDGRAWLTDLRSTNGSFRNGVRLDAGARVPVADGDRLRLGAGIVLKFVRPDPLEERVQREMYERAVRDPLTGLYNRAYFLETLGPLAVRSAARDLGLAVFMLDVDHFKRFNDDYGHPAGDAVLRELSHVLRAATRPEDLVARYGGEEFLVGLPCGSAARALERAERIRRAVASRRMRLGTAEVRVTVSIGVFFAGADRPQAAGVMMSLADLHLYRAKEAGRDRVLGGGEESLGSVAALTTDGEIPAVGTAGVASWAGSRA
jgi:diguanylate cyclase (GGDEF)-like protein